MRHLIQVAMKPLMETPKHRVRHVTIVQKNK